MLSIQYAIQSKIYKGRLDPSIKMLFRKSNSTNIIGNFTANKKSNSFNKTDIRACEWALLSALISLQKRAIKQGANAVNNIVSYYRKNKFVNAQRFEYHAATFASGVALNADVIKNAK